MFLKEGNQHRLISGNPEEIIPILEPGVYTIEAVQERFTTSLFFKKDKRYENTDILDAGVFKKIKEYTETFISPSMTKARKVLKGLNKLGLLLTGDPGTGKTFLAGQIAQKMVDEKKAIAILVNEFWKFNLTKLVDQIRENEPDRFIVVVMDEFEKCQRHHLEDPDLLGFLDGNGSRDNILILGLANATGNMRDFLLDRPGRFEQIFNFDERDSKVIEALVNSMTPKEYKERIDIPFIAGQLINLKKTSVDHIKIAIRDAIAEVIHFEDTGSFKSFNSLNSTDHTKIGKVVGFKNAEQIQEEIQKLEVEYDEITKESV